MASFFLFLFFSFFPFSCSIMLAFKICSTVGYRSTLLLLRFGFTRALTTDANRPLTGTHYLNSIPKFPYRMKVNIFFWKPRCLEGKANVDH